MRRIKFYIILNIFLSCACIFSTTNLIAQHTLLNRDTLILNDGIKFWINEEVIFGSGTMPDRTYTYVYEAPNSLQKLVNNHKRKLLSPGFKGYKSKIIKFEKEIGHNKKGYDYTILVLEMPDGAKYWCDAKNAFSNHEIVLKTSGGAQLTKSETDKNDVDSVTKKKSNPQKTPLKKKATKSTTIF